MAKASPLYGNFNAGEFSPLLDGRVDYAKYGNAASKLENFIPTVQGPLVRRAGTRFVAEAGSTGRVLLQPFEYSVDQAYMLEFGNFYVRFFTWDAITKVRGRLLAVPTAWTTGATYAVGDTVTNGGFTYYCIEAHTAGASFDGSKFYLLPGNIYQVPTPYALADLYNTDGTPRLRFAQSGDFLYIAHPNYQPRILKRLTATKFSLELFNAQGGPWKDLNDTTTEVYASAETGTVTLTASAPIFQAGHVGSLFYLEGKELNAIPAWEPGKTITAAQRRRSDGKTYEAVNSATTGTIRPVHNEGAFLDGDSGVLWQYRDSGYGYVRITAFTSSTVVTAEVIDRLPNMVVSNLNPTTRWAFGAWSSVEGWPSQVAFFRERMWWARGQEVWSSVSAGFSEYAPRIFGLVTADAGFRVLINSGKINDVQWMVPADRDLLVGTAGGEFAIGELTSGEALGPNNRRVRPISSFGSRAIPPVQNGPATLFVQKGGRIVRETFYDFSRDGYESTDATVEAEHITLSGVRDMRFSSNPVPVVWALRTGATQKQLIGFTWNNEQKVRGWHTHPIGGAVEVEAIAVMPAAEGDRSELWLAVRRKGPGASTLRHIEYMEAPYEPDDAQSSQFYVDAGLTYNGAPATTISGLTHLEGQTVDVLADGSPHPQRVVASGQITLQRAASVVHVGLPCPCVYKSMRIEAAASDGTAQGKTKRIHRAVLRFYNTGGGKYGGDENLLDELQFRTSANPMDAAVPLYSGDKVVSWPDGNSTDAYVIYRNDQPTAATLIAVMPQVVTNDSR